MHLGVSASLSLSVVVAISTYVVVRPFLPEHQVLSAKASIAICYFLTNSSAISKVSWFVEFISYVLTDLVQCYAYLYKMLVLVKRSKSIPDKSNYHTWDFTH